MIPSQSIEIQLVEVGGKPLRVPNILVESHFFTRGRFRYSFKVGRTNENGGLRCSYSDIDGIRRRNGIDNLMDYNTRLDDCDPAIELVIPSQQELRDQLGNALRFYQREPWWADPWPANTVQVKKMVTLAEDRVLVTLEIPASPF